MDVREMAEQMMPCWILGAAMLYLVKNSKYAKLIRVEKEGLFKFARFLVMLTAFRFLYLKFIAPESVVAGIQQISNIIPWQTTLGVFWEDACNALPLVIGESLFKKKKWYRAIRLPLLALMALSFGFGHSYEGLGAVIAMTCYIPFTMRLGKKYGFGTVMLCHIAYDMLTLLSFKFFLGI